MRVIRHNRLILDLISVYVEPGVLKSHAYHVSYCQGSPDHDFAWEKQSKFNVRLSNGIFLQFPADLRPLLLKTQASDLCRRWTLWLQKNFVNWKMVLSHQLKEPFSQDAFCKPWWSRPLRSSANPLRNRWPPQSCSPAKARFQRFRSCEEGNDPNFQIFNSYLFWLKQEIYVRTKWASV